MKRRIIEDEDSDSSGEDSDNPSAKRQKTENLDDTLFCPPSFKEKRKKQVSFEWEDELARTCGRPPLPNLSAQKDISFQVVDIDYSYGNPHPIYARHVKGNTWIPHIRLFGVTEEGNSVTCMVHGFLPYFYLPIPLGFYESDCQALCNLLTSEIRKGDPKTRPKTKTYVYSAELVRSKSVMGYTDVDSGFIKVTLIQPKHVTLLRDVIMSGQFIFRGMRFPPEVYEANLEFVLRFMVDVDQEGMKGFSWVTIDTDRCNLGIDSKKTSSQICLDAHWRSIKTHPPIAEWSKTAPIRILSFDIECAGRPGIFPDPEQDPIIDICNNLSIVGKAGRQRIALTYRQTDKLEDCFLFNAKTEEELMISWSRIVEICDPDLITGYNIKNFDLPYLLKRAAQLEIEDEFSYLGRMTEEETKMRASDFESKVWPHSVGLLKFVPSSRRGPYTR